jgi:hypothetical protein
MARNCDEGEPRSASRPARSGRGRRTSAPRASSRAGSHRLQLIGKVAADAGRV